jgi:hypothetical protein
MKKTFNLTTLLLLMFFICCNKAEDTTTSVNLNLVRKWILVETLSDPGDGSGKWKPVSKPNYYFLQFNTDNSIESNIYPDLAGLRHYDIMNDSTVQFIYSSGIKVLMFYKLEGNSLTISGGCDEACGSKFIR